MGFSGPLPKPDGVRQRRNRDTRPLTVIVSEPAQQPALPEDVDWPETTRRWWAIWGESRFAENLQAVDWQYLLDTALLHKRLWERESTEAAKELRLREEAFGVTLAARVRLRIQLAEADAAEARRPLGQAARERYRGLQAADPREVLRQSVSGPPTA